MIKKAVILFLMFSLYSVTLGADAERVLLRDGQVLPNTGLDGKLIKADSNDVLLSDFPCLSKADSWFFKLDEELRTNLYSIERFHKKPPNEKWRVQAHNFYNLKLYETDLKPLEEYAKKKKK